MAVMGRNDTFHWLIKPDSTTFFRRWNPEGTWLPTMQRLFHYSEDPNIEFFIPRPREQRIIEGRSLDELLVWAIDEWHSPMYFFPRDCPRLLLWPIEGSSTADILTWMGERPPRMVAHIEKRWLSRFDTCELYRYEFDGSSFESLYDAGMHVTEATLAPTSVEPVGILRTALESADVELRIVKSLQQVAHALASTLHFSAIRTRNSPGWNPPI